METLHVPIPYLNLVIYPNTMTGIFNKRKGVGGSVKTGVLPSWDYLRLQYFMGLWEQLPILDSHVLIYPILLSVYL